MIAGVCFKDGRIEQVFRRDVGFCQKCGTKLQKLEIQYVNGKLEASVLKE